MTEVEQIAIFAYSTESEALKIAGNTVDPTLVAAVHVMPFRADMKPVAWLVLPVGWNRREKSEG